MRRLSTNSEVGSIPVVDNIYKKIIIILTNK